MTPHPPISDSRCFVCECVDACQRAARMLDASQLEAEGKNKQAGVNVSKFGHENLGKQKFSHEKIVKGKRIVALAVKKYSLRCPLEVKVVVKPGNIFFDST